MTDRLKKLIGFINQKHENILIGIGVLITAGFIIRLVGLCVFDVYGLRDKEAYRTVGITESSEMRGSIYDCNGNTLAYSTPAYNLVFSPYDILEMTDKTSLQSAIEKSSGSEREKAQKALDTLEMKADQKAKQVAVMLASVDPDTDYTSVLSEIKRRVEKNTGVNYYVVLRHIDENARKSIESYLDAYNAKVKEKKDANDANAPLYISEGFDLYFEKAQKRIYPYNETAAIILGYVSDYDNAQNGLEEFYSSELSGVADRRVTSRGTSGIITSVYDEVYEGKDSINLKTTVDVKIQQILEKAIKETQENTNAESVYAVVMRTKTGEILAMGNTPGYNANNPDEPNESEKNLYKFLAEKAKKEAAEAAAAAGAPAAEEETTGAPVSLHREEVVCGTITDRTKNRSLVEPFYPGSIYKAFLVAGALEEGMEINYCCNGVFTIPNSAATAGGADRQITCALDASHGWNDAEHLLINSCNICAAQLGLDMGSETFFKYFQAFGFTEKTGLDLPGGNTNPGSALYYTDYDSTSLATCSFGQNNAVSTVQLALAMSAIGNGGNLMTPYIVAEKTDNEGNIISKTEPVIKRQVVSKKVADTVAGYLESVVGQGSGSKARLEHYRVSGKTGTSQIKDQNEKTIGYVAGFAGFGPTSDPEITVVVNIINPNFNTGTYSDILASEKAAPLAGTILGQTLEYLGIPYDK